VELFAFVTLSATFSPLSLSDALGGIQSTQQRESSLEQTMLGRGTASELGWSLDRNSLIALTGVGAWITLSLI
jgi:hypothetical protein